MSMSTDRYPSSPDIDKCDHDVYFPRTQTGFRFETFVLGDYTAQTLAEQLTLMEQVRMMTSVQGSQPFRKSGKTLKMSFHFSSQGIRGKQKN